MKSRHLLLALAAATTLGSPPLSFAQQPAAVGAAGEPRELALQTKPWQGDFDGMLERRVIRVLAPYSRTLFFNDRGRERGITAELARDFERYVNGKYARHLGRRPVTVFLIATTHDQLLTKLTAGLGDISAGNLTVTAERQQSVDFVAATDHAVRELVITGPKSPELTTLDDLSGKTVHLRRTSSYYESVVALNEKLESARKAPVRIVALPEALEDEDVLEMLNAGLIELAVVDDWLAKIWAQVLPKIKVREDLVLRADAHIGWAIRKASPGLDKALEDFYKVVRKQGGIEERVARQYKLVKRISNNTGTAEWKRFEKTIALFRRYGDRYAFDPLMLVAQGYQESQLNQSARSASGAIGIMQLLPATGADMRVGDIHATEANIHAAAKYMDILMTKYFSDAHFDEDNRVLFALASYNAGPGNIAHMRAEAARRGLDPDKWFNNVEMVVAERIGMETTTYVRNIFKYYAAYKLTLEAQEAGRKARESVGADKS